MKISTRALIRQIAPPFLVSLAHRFFARRRILSAVDPEIPKLYEAFQKRNIGAAENEIVLRDGLRLTIHPDSRYAFEYFCFHSPEMVRELDCFMEKTKDRMRLLDVGALHGIFSLVFARRDENRRAVAVDASPLAFGRLLYNIHRQPWENITPVECAFSDRSGVLKMHYEWEHAVSAQIDDPEQKALSVEMVTGDAWCQANQFSPDTIKIDVEGHELRVIRGLSETFARCRPLLFLELHPTRIVRDGDSLEAIAELLGGWGYTAAHVNGTPLQLADLVRLTEDTRLVLSPG